MTAERTSSKEQNAFYDPSALSTPDSAYQHSWLDEPLGSRNANLGDAVAMLAERDHPIDSIEHDNFANQHDESAIESPEHSSGLSSDGAVFEDDDHHSSPSTSHHSEDEISELPEDTPEGSYIPEKRSSPFTPVKQRSPFRNPSSVRAMQMDTTPPFNYPHYLSSPRSAQYKLSTPSRQGTPRSVRSQNALKPKTSQSKKKEYPLILLHVTFLPVAFPYPLEAMEAVLPFHTIENYNLLRDKISETVLERGILIPHPREDYELLEERLLESIELKLPRILKCGHFHLDEEHKHDESEDEEGYNSEDCDADICEDCGRRIRDGKYGTGSGNRRWDIKIYAANGLMRSGAWAAAWREMERVDVEIGPWIPEAMRRELDLRREEQQLEERKSRDEAEEKDRRMREENIREASPRKRGSRRKPSSVDVQNERMREIYGTAIPVRNDIFEQEKFTHGEKPGYTSEPQQSTKQSREQIPLITLLQNYIYLLARDKRNIAILLLSLLVLALSISLRNNTTTSQFMTHVASSIPASENSLSTTTHAPVAAVSAPDSASAVDIGTRSTPTVLTETEAAAPPSISTSTSTSPTSSSLSSETERVPSHPSPTSDRSDVKAPSIPTLPSMEDLSNIGSNIRDAILPHGEGEGDLDGME
ncbi:MAG: hypothetical protein M1827_003336 [Pycnora praestabilis]|nr:MAG: hypothetical protein M1827_003336 [Pycnora praestabilis]